MSNALAIHCWKSVGDWFLFEQPLWAIFIQDLGYSRLRTRYTTSMAPAKPERRLASFRCIPPTLKRSVDLFADELQVPVGYVARILLEFSLCEHRQGRLKLVPKMSPWGWTLYPNDVHRQTKPVSFRYIPDTLFQDIQTVAGHLKLGNGLFASVNKGEVTWKFLEYGLAEHKKQRLSRYFARVLDVYSLFTLVLWEGL